MQEAVHAGFVSLAPEKINDASRVDARADHYSIGITLYECLTGSLPFPEYSIQDVINAQRVRTVPSVRHLRVDLSPAWDKIIARACAKDRRERYASAGEMLRDLSQLSRSLHLDERTTQALPPISRAIIDHSARPTSAARGTTEQPSAALALALNFGETFELEENAEVEHDTLFSQQIIAQPDLHEPLAGIPIDDTLPPPDEVSPPIPSTQSNPQQSQRSTARTLPPSLETTRSRCSIPRPSPAP